LRVLTLGNKMVKLTERLDKKRIKELEETGRIKILSYGNDNRFFAIVDSKNLYKHVNDSDGDYVLLKENYLEKSI